MDEKSSTDFDFIFVFMTIIGLVRNRVISLMGGTKKTQAGQTSGAEQTSASPEQGADMLGSLEQQTQITKKLREYYDSVQDEGIPDRFLDLLEKLDEAEKAANASAKK